MAETVRLTPNMIDGQYDRLVVWARANGLDPVLIPAGSVVVCEGGKLTVEQYVRREEGGLRLDDERTAALRTTLTVDLAEDLPADLIAKGVASDG